MLPKERRVISPTVERMSNVHKRSRSSCRRLSSFSINDSFHFWPISSTKQSKLTLFVSKTCFGTEMLLLAAVSAAFAYLSFPSFAGISKVPLFCY